MNQESTIEIRVGLKMKVRYISPECHTHDHVRCPVKRIVKCECICHKVVGE